MLVKDMDIPSTYTSYTDTISGYGTGSSFDQLDTYCPYGSSTVLDDCYDPYYRNPRDIPSLGVSDLCQGSFTTEFELEYNHYAANVTRRKDKVVKPDAPPPSGSIEYDSVKAGARPGDSCFNRVVKLGAAPSSSIEYEVAGAGARPSNYSTSHQGESSSGETETSEATPQPDLTDDVVCPSCHENSTSFSFDGRSESAQRECESCRLSKGIGGAHDTYNQTEDRSEQWGEDDLLSYYCGTDTWGSARS